MAVPGPVTSALSVGCHRMLREPGTIAVTRAEEVVEEIGRIGLDLASVLPDAAPARATDGLAKTALRVHEALSDRVAHDCDQLSVESGLPVDVVRAALPELVRVGLVERVDGGWRRATRDIGRGGA
jgi:DNA processing protein